MELRLDFTKENENRRNPTRSEIAQIGYLALGVEGIIKMMGEYCNASQNPHEACGYVQSVTNVLEHLMIPIIDYLSNYAGDEASKE